MSQSAAFPTVLVLVAVVIAAVTDVWKLKIYNALTLPLLIFGLAYQGTVGGTADFLSSVWAVGFAFGVLILPYVMGLVGAGDVKLVVGIGAWLGMPLTCYVLLISCVAAGVYSAFAVLIRGSVKEAWIELQVGWHRLRAIGRQLATEDRVESRVTMPDRRRRLIPFGAMVAVGVMAALVWANWLVTALR